MERKKAIVTAAIVSGAVFAASAAIGVNVGLLSSSAETNPVGELQANDLADVGTTSSTTVPEPVTVFVDDYVTDPAAPAQDSGWLSVPDLPGIADPAGPSSDSGSGSETQIPQPASPNAGSPGSSYSDDDSGSDDDRYEAEEHEREEEHEVLEGHDDDD